MLPYKVMHEAMKKPLAERLKESPTKNLDDEIQDKGGPKPPSDR